MKRYLRQITKDHENVQLIPETELPRQNATDYDDLTHVNEVTQARFTDWFANRLTSVDSTKVASKN